MVVIHKLCGNHMRVVWELYGRNPLHISTVYGSMWLAYNSHVVHSNSCMVATW